VRSALFPHFETGCRAAPKLEVDLRAEYEHPFAKQRISNRRACTSAEAKATDSGAHVVTCVKM
jgi:hypothetical protein